MLPVGYDPPSFDAAVETARAESFMLGVIYRRPIGRLPATAEPGKLESVGIWPPVGATAGSTCPGWTERRGGMT